MSEAITYSPWIQGPDWQGANEPYFAAQIAFPRGSSVGLPTGAVQAGTMGAAFAGALGAVGNAWGTGAAVETGNMTIAGLQGVMNIYSTGTDDHEPWYGQAEAADYSLYVTAPPANSGDYARAIPLPPGAFDVQLEDTSSTAFDPVSIHSTVSIRDEGQGMNLYAAITVRPADSITDNGGVPMTVDERMYGGSGLTRTVVVDMPSLGATGGALMSLVLDAAQSQPTPVGPTSATNPAGTEGDSYEARQYLKNVGQMTVAGVYKPPRHRFVFYTDPVELDLLMRATSLTRVDDATD